MGPEQTAVDPAKVAVYIRWSTEDQSDGTTLEVQSETCRAYVASQGWVVSPDLLFVDDGYSGGSLERPAMARLRKEVAAGRVDCVVVYKLDRLSRSVVDTVNLVCREWEGKCSIKSAREPIDTTSHAGKMFFYTLVNYAEWERSVIKERTYSGKLRRAQEGRNPGFKPPFGYAAADGGAFAVVPSEAAIVRRIYREYLAGMGIRQITARLNQDGIVPREAAAWGQSTVQRILANPAYVGRLEYGRRRRIGSSRVMKAAAVVVQSTRIPPIVSQCDWDTVQALKQTRPGFGRGTGSGRSYVSESLLSGLLECRCGHGFTGKAMAGPYRYYRCMGSHMKGSAYCGCGGIRQELLDRLVVDALRRLYRGPAVKERLLHSMLFHYRHQLLEARSALKALEGELEKLRTGEQRLKRLLREGDLSVAEYRELMDDLHKEAEGLREAEARASQTEREALAGLSGQERLEGSLTRLDEWEHLDLVAKKQLLRQFIQAIRVYKAPGSQTVDCDIAWRWETEKPPEEGSASKKSSP